MHFDPDHYHEIMKHLNYLAGQSKALKTMAKNKRNFYDIAVMMLAAVGACHKVFPLFYSMLHTEIIDFSNTLLDHPGIDEPTRLKLQHIRVSANDMDVIQLAKTMEELERIKKLLP